MGVKAKDWCGRLRMEEGRVSSVVKEKETREVIKVSEAEIGLIGVREMIEGSLA